MDRRFEVMEHKGVTFYQENGGSADYVFDKRWLSVNGQYFDWVEGGRVGETKGIRWELGSYDVEQLTKELDKLNLGKYMGTVTEIYNPDEKCTSCNANLYRKEAIATFFGGWANPKYDYSCLDCVSKSNEAYEAMKLDAELYQSRLDG